MIAPSDTCWDCRHLTSRIHAAPPVYCRAYPDGVGVPFEILGGIVRHDNIIGGEAEMVTFERREQD